MAFDANISTVTSLSSPGIHSEENQSTVEKVQEKITTYHQRPRSDISIINTLHVNKLLFVFLCEVTFANLL